MLPGHFSIRHGDAFLLQTALTNLVQNAADFSPDGAVISVGLKTVDARACFVVEDEGPGLPEYAKSRVFERFYSLPRPHNGKKSSGLGLCFVRETALLVANHGQPFDVERITSLTRLGSSDKKARRTTHHQIGYKGIGFTSVSTEKPGSQSS